MCPKSDFRKTPFDSRLMRELCVYRAPNCYYRVRTYEKKIIMEFDSLRCNFFHCRFFVKNSKCFNQYFGNLHNFNFYETPRRRYFHDFCTNPALLLTQYFGSTDRFLKRTSFQVASNSIVTRKKKLLISKICNYPWNSDNLWLRFFKKRCAAKNKQKYLRGSYGTRIRFKTRVDDYLKYAPAASVYV